MAFVGFVSSSLSPISVRTIGTFNLEGPETYIRGSLNITSRRSVTVSSALNVSDDLFIHNCAFCGKRTGSYGVKIMPDGGSIRSIGHLQIWSSHLTISGQLISLKTLKLSERCSNGSSISLFGSRAVDIPLKAADHVSLNKMELSFIMTNDLILHSLFGYIVLDGIRETDFADPVMGVEILSIVNETAVKGRVEFARSSSEFHDIKVHSSTGILISEGLSTTHGELYLHVGNGNMNLSKGATISAKNGNLSIVTAYEYSTIFAVAPVKLYTSHGLILEVDVRVTFDD